MVLRGWGARVCALRKSRTRAREPGGGSRPGLLSLGHHHCLPPLSLAARRSIRLPRTCRAPLCLICPQVVWWRWRWWRRRAAHRATASRPPPRSCASSIVDDALPPLSHPRACAACRSIRLRRGTAVRSNPLPARLWLRLFAGQGEETDGSSGVVAGVFSRPSGSRRRRARRSRRRRSTTTPALLPDRYRRLCRPSFRQCSARLYRRSSAPSS